MLHEQASIADHKPITPEDYIRLAKQIHTSVLDQAKSGDKFSLDLINESHALNQSVLNEGIKPKLQDKTRGRPMIDLGAGKGLDQDTVEYFGFSPYWGTDLLAKRSASSHRMMESMDSLEFLLKLPDGFGNIMANGFLCRDWFSDSMRVYVEQTLKHVRRVLPRNGVFIATHFDFLELAGKVGLRVNEELSRIRGNILVFERGQPIFSKTS